MAYIGQRPVIGRYIKLDQISSGFNGSNTGFSMTAGSQAVFPGTARNLLLSLGGVIQEPDTDFTISGSTLTFTTAPVANTTFFGVIYGDMQATGTPSDGTVLPASIASSGHFKIPQLTVNEDGADVDFRVEGDTEANLLFVDASTDRIGIGTNSPGALLHLQTATPVIRFTDSDTSRDSQIVGIDGNLRFDADNNDAQSGTNISFKTDNVERLKIDGTEVVVNDTGASVDFRVEGDTSSHLLFLDAGNDRVGIKASSPATPLHVGGTIHTTTNVAIRITSSTNNLHVHQDDSDKSIAQFTNTATGSAAGDGFQIGLASSEDGLINMKESKSIFFKTADSDAMAIDSSGNVGIGTTTPDGKLDVRGTIFVNGDGTGGRIFASSGNLSLSDGNGRQVLRIDDPGASNTHNHIFDSNGRLGIGTTSPDTLLHLSGEDTAVIRLENTDTTLGTDQIIGGIEFEKQDPTGAGVGIAGAIRLKSMSSVGQAASMFFNTSNSSGNDQTRMTIDFDGRVGIGTTTMNHVLDVQGANNTTFDHVAVLSLKGTDAYNSGNAGSGINFGGKFNSSGQTSTFAQVSGIKENTGDGEFDGALTFGVRNDTEGVNIERMRIASNGDVYVNRTTDMDLGANNVTGICLLASGRIKAARNGSAALQIGRQQDTGEVALFSCQGTSIVGSIQVTTTSATLQSGTSDRSTKKNFEDWTEDTLSLFKNLKPQKFNFIIEDDGAEKTKGYIAQDLVDSFPEAYPKNSEDKYMFSPGSMVVYLMKAIQELEAKVAALEAA